MSYDNVMNGYDVTAEQGERMIAAALGQTFVPPAPYNNVANRTHMTAEQGERLIEAIEQGGGGTTNYNNLNNKPSINGVTLTGNKTTQELNITASGAEVYDDYEDAVTAINAWAADHRGVGDNVYIRTANVPDLWVSGVWETSAPYTYTTDAAIIAALEADGYVQFGYYKLSALETQKVNVPTINVDDVQVQQLDLHSATLTLYEVGSTTPVSYKIYAEEA